MEKCSVSKATLGRLPCYLQHLRAILKNNDEYVSATTIAKELSLGEVQVRKDLNSISGAGRPKIGYAVKDLIESIKKTENAEERKNKIDFSVEHNILTQQEANELY